LVEKSFLNLSILNLTIKKQEKSKMKRKRKFPTTQAGKLALAHEMVHGFEENKDVYDKPPIDVTAQKARLAGVQGKINVVTQAEAALKLARQDLGDEIDLMEDEMGENLDYAEFVTKDDDAKLRFIGWSGRAEPKKMEKPGQSKLLEIVKQGAGWFKCDWKDPSDGGKVQVYKIMRRIVKDGGDMKEASSSIISEASLFDQPRGIELEFAVVGANKAGESEPSNSITITL
jgi:hypothetical protein